jgi:hypothetical protein
MGIFFSFLNVYFFALKLPSSRCYLELLYKFFFFSSNFNSLIFYYKNYSPIDYYLSIYIIFNISFIIILRFNLGKFYNFFFFSFFKIILFSLFLIKKT